MGKPAVLTQTGTGTVIWTPDWALTPFSIGIGLITNTTGVNGTATVDVTFSDINTVDVNGVATSAATWFSVIGPVGANATANFTTPVQAIRMNVITATATSSWTVNFVQAALQF